MENEIKTGNFKINDWLKQGNDEFSYRRLSDNSFSVMLNPYEPITECGVLPTDLKVLDRIKDQDGIILKIIDFGSSGLFGKYNWSWIWVSFLAENTKFQDSLPHD